MTAAAKLSQQSVRQVTGTVTRASATNLAVVVEDCEYRAERAVSCLVEPVPEDFVLLALLPSGQAYVLAVLTRTDADATLSIEGDLRIRPGGRIALSSTEGISLATPGDVSCAAGQLDVNAVHGVVGLQQLRYVGQFVQAEVAQTKLFGTSVDRLFDRVTEKVKRAYRTVEELDQLKAGRIDYSAKKTLRMHAKHTLMTARELIKLDGEQIHMG